MAFSTKSTSKSSTAPAQGLGSLAGAWAEWRAKHQPATGSDASGPAIGTPANAYEWAKSRRRIEGQPFTLDKHKPLRQIYEDNHEFIAIMKPAQKGVSELAIAKAFHTLEFGATLWAPEKDGLNVGYIFPHRDALGDFSKERLSSLPDESPELAALFAGNEGEKGGAGYKNVTFKQIGRSYLYLRGAQAPAGLKAFPADMIILDEYDEMAPNRISMAWKRLLASPVAKRLALSTPTTPGRGIHALYLNSDQHVWQVPCAHCEGWTDMDVFRDLRGTLPGSAPVGYSDWQYWQPVLVRAATWTVHCGLCEHQIDPFADGRWYALKPEQAGIRGYQVPALAFPSAKVVDIVLGLTSDDPSTVEETYRSDLGMPYEPDGARITAEMLAALSVGLPNGALPQVVWRNVSMGVDVGARWHYRISGDDWEGKRVVLAMGAVRSWEDLDTLMLRYRVRKCVVDYMPELHGTAEWARKHKGRVVRAMYPNGMPGDLYVPKPNKEDPSQSMVHVNRTRALDSVFARISSESELWPALIAQNAEVQAHMKASQRVNHVTPSGEVVAQWIHQGDDHLMHACVYDIIAQELVAKAPAIPAVLAQGKARGW